MSDDSTPRRDARWIRVLWAIELAILFLTSVLLADDLRLIPVWALTAMALLMVQMAAMRAADDESRLRPPERHRDRDEVL